MNNANGNATTRSINQCSPVPMVANAVRARKTKAMSRSMRLRPLEYHQTSSVHAIWSDGMAFRGPGNAAGSKNSRGKLAIGNGLNGKFVPNMLWGPQPGNTL